MDPLRKEITQTLDETEKTSRIVNRKLASIIHRLNKLSYEQLKEEYFSPKNCDCLIVPKVSPEIWEKLDHPARGRDLQLSAIQSTMTNIAIQTTNKLLVACNSVQRTEY